MVKDHPQISVVIPLYNKERYIKRTLDSVLAQTFQNFEIIIVNDGSTDQSPRIVEQYDDPRIRLINQENAGVSAARNRGIKETKAELIAFLDADDEWLPVFLDTVRSLVERHPKGGLYATSYFFASDNGSRRQARIRGIPQQVGWEGIIPNYFRSARLGDDPVCSSAVCIPLLTIEKVGLFSVGVCCGEDLDLWFRIALKYPVVFSSLPQAIYHCANSSATQRYFGQAAHCKYLRWLSYGAFHPCHNDIEQYALQKQCQVIQKALVSGDRQYAIESLRQIRSRHYVCRRLALLLACMFPAQSTKYLAGLSSIGKGLVRAVQSRLLRVL